MRTIFSTADVPAADAYDYWMEVACTNIVKHRGETFDRCNFYATLRAGLLSDLSFLSWRASPGITYGDGADDLWLSLPSSRSLVEFDRRAGALSSTDAVLFDAREPYTARSLEPVARSVVRIPRDALTRRLSIDAVVNQAIPPEGDAALAVGFARQVMRLGPSTLSATAAALAREQMLDLIAVTLSNLTGQAPKLGAASRFSMLKLRAAIDQQLSEPDADPQSIAAAARMRERQADRLLAQEGSSIRHLLMERRLNKCREALADKLEPYRSIRDIALSFGFRDVTHFTRAFSRRYGVSPRDYRRSVASEDRASTQQSEERRSDGFGPPREHRS